MGRISSVVWRFISLFEARVLAIWIALATIVWSFVSFASEVSERETDVLDRKILMIFRAPGALGTPLGPPWLQDAVRDVTALGGVTVLTLLVFAAAVALLLHRMWRQATILVVTVMLAEFTNAMLKAFYSRVRPELALQAVRVYSRSFPSGHATMAATTYLTLAVMVSSLGAARYDKIAAFGFAIFLTVMIGASRVYLGVHWPSDVIAGWMTGGAWALAAHLVLHFGPRTMELGSHRADRGTSVP